MELGARNDTAIAQEVYAGGGSGDFVANGGTGYSADVDYHGVAFGALLPGVTVCGQIEGIDGGQVQPPVVAEGDVPSGVRLTKLNLWKGSPVDLTQTKAPHCSPKLPSGVQQTPISVPIGESSAPLTAKLDLQGVESFPQEPTSGMVRLNATVKNEDTSATFQAGSFEIWLLDADGIARFSPWEREDTWDSSDCVAPHDRQTLTVPPAGTARVNACFAYRPTQKPTLAVIYQPATHTDLLVHID